MKREGLPLVFLVAILVATALVYWPGLDGGFIFDDYQNLLLNSGLRVTDLRWSNWVTAMFSSPASELQRPLAMLSFAANHYFTGFDARAMKLTNLAVHGLNVVLAFLLLRRIAERVADADSALRVAIVAAAGWAVHPINLMVVLYVVQRMEGLSQSFVLLGLILYMIGRNRQGEQGKWLVLAALGFCTLLGVLAKESAVLLPVYALLLECCLFRFRQADGRFDRKLAAIYGLTLVLPVAVGLVWLLPRVLAPDAFAIRDFGLGERLLTEGRVVCNYLYWTVLPDLGRLSLYHDDYVISHGLLSPPSTLAALVFLAAIATTAWLLRIRRPLTALGLGWFLAAQLLTATIVPLELVFEHRNYFASLGICLVLADLCVLLPSPRLRPLALLVALALLAFFAGTTRLRSTEWSNPLVFAETEAAKHPDSPRATYDLARSLIIAGRYDRSSPFTLRARPAVERAVRAPGSDALPYQAALMLAARTGAPLQKAWWLGLQAKLKSHPGKPENQLALIALTDCAVGRLCDFPPDDMIESFQAALEPGDQPVILGAFGSYALGAMGDREFALRLWQASTRLDPNNSQIQKDTTRLEISLGRYAEAAERIRSLRKRGRFGQNASLADSLLVELDRAQRHQGLVH